MAGTSLFVQGGNWLLPAFYVLGSITISCIIWRSQKFKPETIDKICFAIVVGSLFLWAGLEPWYATVVATIGVVVATYPQIDDSIKEPEKSPIGIYIGFAIVNAFGTLAGNAWTVEQRLYTSVCVLLCLVVILFSLRKYAEKPHGA